MIAAIRLNRHAQPDLQPLIYLISGYQIMKLEVDEIVITNSAVVEEVQKLDFSCPVLLQVDDEHYLQWWVDEDDGEIALCWRNGGWDTYKICELGQYDGEKIKPVFLEYLAGNQSGLDQFEWEAGQRPGDPGVITTDHWEYYPCQFEDESVGSIFYNHGISEIIEELEATQCIRFRLTLNEPTEEGFPTDEENDVLEDIAQELDKFVHEHNGNFFGHVTNQGTVVFYTYANADRDASVRFLKQIEKQFGYEMDVTAEEDPDRGRYWEDLFPDPFSWQLLNDIKVTQQLEEAGDDLTKPRLIDHFASFASQDSLQSFSNWATSEGFEIEKADADENGARLEVKFTREDAPELGNINPITFGIREKCIDLEGSYDGWETFFLNRVSLNSSL